MKDDRMQAGKHAQTSTVWESVQVEIGMSAKGGAWIAGANPERFADALSIQLSLIGA